MQPRRHLSQMHTNNYMPFIRGKDGFLKKKKSETIGVPPLRIRHSPATHVKGRVIDLARFQNWGGKGLVKNYAHPWRLLYICMPIKVTRFSLFLCLKCTEFNFGCRGPWKLTELAMQTLQLKREYRERCRQRMGR